MRKKVLPLLMIVTDPRENMTVLRGLLVRPENSLSPRYFITGLSSLIAETGLMTDVKTDHKTVNNNNWLELRKIQIPSLGRVSQ